MYIKIKNKEMYLQIKKRNRPPIMTPFKDKAADFKSLAECQRMRDDALEYYPQNLVIIG